MLSICVYFSFLFSLTFSVCFYFFCLPLFCSQEVVWCNGGLTGPALLYSLFYRPALALFIIISLGRAAVSDFFQRLKHNRLSHVIFQRKEAFFSQYFLINGNQFAIATCIKILLKCIWLPWGLNNEQEEPVILAHEQYCPPDTKSEGEWHIPMTVYLSHR